MKWMRIGLWELRTEYELWAKPNGVVLLITTGPYRRYCSMVGLYVLA